MKVINQSLGKVVVICDTFVSLELQFKMGLVVHAYHKFESDRERIFSRINQVVKVIPEMEEQDFLTMAEGKIIIDADTSVIIHGNRSFPFNENTPTFTYVIQDNDKASVLTFALT